MKKIFSLFTCALLVFCLAMPAFAAGPTVPFTPDSLPEVGGTLTVDKDAMLNSDSLSTEMHNALLEGSVICSWYKNGMLTREGIGAESFSYELALSDQGCTIYVKLSFYVDSSFQESKKCGEAVSTEFTVTGPAPEITNESLPVATVGTAYYVKLECTDPDAAFSEIMGSQLSEFGLSLTQHGEIEGTPSKAGNCHVNILALSEGGGEYSVSFDLTVNAAAAAAPVEITTKSLPEAIAGQAYQVTLRCTDEAAIFGIFYNPGKANDFEETGLTLQKDGNLSGTPTTAGSYTFCVCAAGASGEDYIVYTLEVKAAEPDPDAAPEEAPPEETPVSGNAPGMPVETAPTETQPQAHTPPPVDKNAALPWWGYLLIVLGSIAAGIGITLIMIKLKKKT